MAPLVRRLVKATSPPGAAGMDPVRKAWDDLRDPETVGTLPLRLSRAGVLQVACADAGQAMALTARREELWERLQRAVPDAGLTGIRFSVSDTAVSLPPALAEPPPARAPRPPTAAERERAEALVAEVSDPELRALLARAAALGLRRSGGRNSLQNAE